MRRVLHVPALATCAARIQRARLPRQGYLTWHQPELRKMTDSGTNYWLSNGRAEQVRVLLNLNRFRSSLCSFRIQARRQRSPLGPMHNHFRLNLCLCASGRGRREDRASRESLCLQVAPESRTRGWHLPAKTLRGAGRVWALVYPRVQDQAFALGPDGLQQRAHVSDKAAPNVATRHSIAGRSLDRRGLNRAPERPKLYSKCVLEQMCMSC